MDKYRPYITIYRPFGTVARYCIHGKKNGKYISGFDYIIKVKSKYPNVPIYDISNVKKHLTKNSLYFKTRIQ